MLRDVCELVFILIYLFIEREYLRRGSIGINLGRVNFIITKVVLHTVYSYQNSNQLRKQRHS